MSLKIPVNNKDHVSGNTKASLLLVEYGDFQCPYCGEAYYEIKKVQKELGDKLKFVFRNFPLTNVHEHALSAAVSSEVASEMGKYWEMHDMLFENQNALSDFDLLFYAEKIGLDKESFENKFKEPKFVDKIENDIEGGLLSGVNGTPSFFINGIKYEGPYTANGIIEYIQNL